MRAIPVYAITLLVSFAAWCGCGSSDPWKEDYADLLQQSVALEYRHCQLKARIDSLWDVTTIQLERSLPPGFPSVDRDIFLKARNADHIRMFMSFKQLDSGVQSLIDNAGKYDAFLATQIHALSEQRDAYEQQKIRFLRKVAAQDDTESRKYAEALRQAPSRICP